MDPDGDAKMGDKGKPAAEENQEKTGRGVHFASFQEVGGDVMTMIPFLVECKVTAQSGERPFDVWKDQADELMESLKKAKETNANFKVCTLGKTSPYKHPGTLPLDWTVVKRFIHSRRRLFQEGQCRQAAGGNGQGNLLLRRQGGSHQ